jgi:HSP20 family protein
MSLKNLLPSLAKKGIPVKYDYSPLNVFSRDFDRFFDDFFSGFELEPFGSQAGSFNPNIEVSDSEKEITVSVELPGLEEKDIDISIAQDTLTISGEKKREHEKKEKGYFLKERTYGSFRRSIPLQYETEPKKAKARFKKGVLTITLPKSVREIERTRKIHINVD